MRLPMNLRVKWYEHIGSRSDRATLTEFEKWLCKRVDTLFNSVGHNTTDFCQSLERLDMLRMVPLCATRFFGVVRSAFSVCVAKHLQLYIEIHCSIPKRLMS